MASKDYTTGWQDSEVATKYVYSRLHEILNTDGDDNMIQELSLFYSEIARTYLADTGEKIGSPTRPAELHSIL